MTYCPLCNSGVVFDRRVDGRDLTFGTTGKLRHSDLVMWDRQTDLGCSARQGPTPCVAADDTPLIRKPADLREHASGAIDADRRRRSRLSRREGAKQAAF